MGGDISFLGPIADRAVNVLAGVAGAAGLVVLAVGALKHMAAVSPVQIEEAKSLMGRSVIGFGVAVLAKSIWAVVKYVFGA